MVQGGRGVHHPVHAPTPAPAVAQVLAPAAVERIRAVVGPVARHGVAALHAQQGDQARLGIVAAQADAGTALTGAGLTLGTVTQQCSNTVAAGFVISQTPAAGAEIPFHSAVALVVSTDTGTALPYGLK